MTCDEAIGLLMEADPEDIRRTLEASAPSEVPGGGWEAHVARCDDCRSVAGRILEGDRELAEAVLGMPPPEPFPTAWARAEVEARARAARRRRLGSTWVVGAAAAAVAGVLLFVSGNEGGGPSRPGTDAPALASSPLQTASLPAVETLEPGSVAVMQTSDPDVVVFWFFGGES